MRRLTNRWTLIYLNPKAGGSFNITGVGNIASAEAFGSPALTATINATGIVTAEVFGNAAATVNVNVSSITSAEVFGSPSATLNINATGVASTEAFGSPATTLNLGLLGITSAETFGGSSVTVNISLNGISTAEAFGTPTLVPVPVGSHTLLGVGQIVSGEMFGNPTISVDSNNGVFFSDGFARTQAPRRAILDFTHVHVGVEVEVIDVQEFVCSSEAVITRPKFEGLVMKCEQEESTAAIDYLVVCAHAAVFTKVDGVDTVHEQSMNKVDITDDALEQLVLMLTEAA